MSFRDWRTRRIVGLALAWILGVFAWVTTVSTPRTREEERKHPDAAVYVSVYVSGGILVAQLGLGVRWVRPTTRGDLDGRSAFAAAAVDS